VNTSWTTGWKTEFCFFQRNNSSGVVHGESWQDYGSRDFTFRWNKMEDICGSAFVAMKMSAATIENYEDWHVYGNIMYCTSSQYSTGIGGCGVFGNTAESEGYYLSNINFHHNTVYSIGGINAGNYFYMDDGSSRLYNNLFIGCSAGVDYLAGMAGQHDYCAYYGNDSVGDVAANDILLEADPCTNSSEYDFTLTYDLQGLAQSAPYNIDMFGNTNNNIGALAYGG
jgi:hypothetical protein